MFGAGTACLDLEAADEAAMDMAHIALLGEVYDNPHHHRRQACAVARMSPKALVFEMLSPAQAERVLPENRGDAHELERALEWNASGWPDFDLYHPIFVAAPEATVFGAALPRSLARTAFEDGAAGVFAGDATAFGLTTPLPADQQEARESLQFAAHCEAMPRDMMAGMVEAQRLKDAQIARVALDALAQTGGPVAVILGNGHARSDWGVPWYLRQVAPEVALFSLGQGEDDGAPLGRFDHTILAPAPKREDPCAAFQ